MPSPFPGMDPYLEDPAIWPDFRDAFAAEIRAALNASLPAPYYARLEMRPEIGIIDKGESHRIVPDVSIQTPRKTVPTLEAGTTNVALAEPRAEPSESIRVAASDEPLRHQMVEIRDGSRGHLLVTLIEIVSPSHERRGDDRRAYRRKQQEVLDSDAGLVEIDLHSTGEPVVGAAGQIEPLKRSGRAGRYVVCVSRAWERSPVPQCEIYPFGLSDLLLCVSIPLRESDPEVLLDLQYVLQRAYDGGPYRRGAVDYSQPPTVAMTDDERHWVREQVASAFPGSSEAPR